MVFGISTRKERRVPDLSRYDYYYQNKGDYNTSNDISIDAAYSVATGHAPGNEYSKPRSIPSTTRTRSMVNLQQNMRNNNNVNANNNNRRGSHSSNLQNYKLKNSSNGGRSYSLRSQASSDTLGANRLNSITSTRRGSAPKAKISNTANGNSSRANSITVQTTEVKDPHGKTQSITRKTIKRVNGYEYVETTTTTTQTIKSPLQMSDADRHFDEFSDNFIQDEPISEILEEEEFDMTPEIAQNGEFESSDKHVHGYRALVSPVPPLANEQNGIIPLDDTSSISKFTDAEELETAPNKMKRSVKQKKRAPRDKRSSLRKSHAPSVRNSTHEVKQRTPNARQSTVIPEPQHNQPLTEEEMYARAYEIASKKVYQNRMPGTENVGDNKSHMSNRMSLRGNAGTNAGTNKLNLSQKRGSSMPAANNVLHSKSVPTSSNKFGSNQPKVNTSQRGSAVVGGVPSTTSPMSDEEMYSRALEIAQKRYDESHQFTNAIPLKTPVKNVSGMPVANSVPATMNRPPANEQNIPSQVVENIVPTTSEAETNSNHKFLGLRKVSTASIGGGKVAGEQISKVSTEPHPNGKFKFKNVIDKVVQFSNENSGYQPSKKELLEYEKGEGEKQLDVLENKGVDIVDEVVSPQGIEVTPGHVFNATEITSKTSNVISDEISPSDKLASIPSDFDRTSDNVIRQVSTKESSTGHSFKASSKNANLSGSQGNSLFGGISNNFGGEEMIVEEPVASVPEVITPNPMVDLSRHVTGGQSINEQIQAGNISSRRKHSVTPVGNADEIEVSKNSMSGSGVGDKKPKKKGFFEKLFKR
ncbi:hypothetical protein Kpol_529p1 [Vanderwaltozyma polyspora DSM 70294]|uniref:Meiotic sister-chromatid recombination protein 3 n=1 Tax=Vanderwaltozyma polyspora (strain ATCC 22028 / DSM 70294 / BCRC 21397 / CBS 2163 / NBRC 10782 / NRRL Y-8283 / UCD 57-17) TaxID=436907 RepID=A7TM54_VANPO|nr:uncharacterized protein Kpol_529p1 [Vanderwaltozyma polyspora DSM 70294]EDO16621.1 hypothetical protein Kpol_529p1 [Vanderwaltozyma polyspora DSM 70294]